MNRRQYFLPRQGWWRVPRADRACSVATDERRVVEALYKIRRTCGNRRILPLALGVGFMFRMNWTPEATIAAAWLIFIATYAVVALGKIPVYRIDRAGAALLGGSLMVATGVLSLEEAYRAVDFNTIVLLLGMMIVVANLRLQDFSRHHPLDRSPR